jgi:Rrf2 family nitric oxide-sensitive transcriptional repressor
MFSQTLEYALRVVVHLAGLEGVPATTREISVATQVPESYLAKVIQGLNKGGLVSSQRGLHGGSVLARDPSQITLFDVAQAIAPLPRIRTCPLGLKSHGTQLCSVHKRLDDAMEHVENVFRTSTIADLLADPNESKPLQERTGACQEPRRRLPPT